MKGLLPKLLLVFSVGAEAETIKLSNGGDYVGQVPDCVPHGLYRTFLRCLDVSQPSIVLL